MVLRCPCCKRRQLDLVLPVEADGTVTLDSAHVETVCRDRGCKAPFSSPPLLRLVEGS